MANDAVKAAEALIAFLKDPTPKPEVKGVWTTTLSEKGVLKLTAFLDEVEALRFAVDHKSSTPQFVSFGEPTAIT